MKVLFIIPYLATAYGGPAKVVQELSQSLSRLDVSVDIITTNANVFEKLDVPLGVWVQKNGYRVRYFNCWHKNALIISSALIHWLYNNIQDYDVVHTNNRFSPLILCTEWICSSQKIPFLVTPHGMLEPWALSYKAWKKHLYHKFLEEPALQRASAIHALTNVEAEHIHALGLQQTAVIPNGIHRSEFETLPDPELFYHQFPHTRGKTLILFLGRLDPKKGLDLLAPALAKIRHLFPHVHLVVAGPDNAGFLPVARNYFAQANCLDTVTFTGMLTGSLKRAALAAASLYISPSYSEGFSMSVLEGMASGLPCIITKGCNFPEAEAARVVHVVETDVGEITSALMQCLNHPQEAKRMGDRARQFIFQNYTWDHAAKKLVQVYEKTVANGAKLL